jgi:transmembrane sensor
MSKEEYIRKWIDGTLTEEEKVAFESSEDFKNLEGLNEAIKSFKAPEYNVESSLNELKSRKEKSGKVVRFPLIKSVARVAAVLLLIISGYFFFYLNINTTVETAVAEKKEIYLPDSSLVNVNALSQLTFKANIWKYKREIQLQGEAFFSVARGAQFDVITSSGTVSVLGTQFNVKNRGEFFEVVCYEGKVQVLSENKSDELLPGESFRVVNGQAEKYETSNESSPGWISNQSNFKSVPYGQVIEELERQYGVIVKTEDLDMEELFTGSFEHDDLKLALRAITTPLNIQYQILSDDQIILSSQSD